MLDRLDRSLSRTAFRGCYRLAFASGVLSVRLARVFRLLGRQACLHGPLVIAAQLPVLLAWLPARAVFIVSAAQCHALSRRRLRLEHG